MIKISEPTRQELEQGYQICPCKHGVHLLQAGFDVDLRHADRVFSLLRILMILKLLVQLRF